MSVNSVDTSVRPDRTAARPPSPAALVAVGLAALIAVLDGTVVAVALDTLSTSLHASLSGVVWVTVAYLLAAAAMLPLLNVLTVRFGARTVFLAGLVVFLLGSTLCALAWSAPSLVGFRVVQGLGGGLLEPGSLALAAGLARPERIGRVLGLLSMVINLAPVLGPVVGGLLLETGHWQWLFIVNLPLGIAVFIAALAFVPADRPDADGAGRSRVDGRGLALLTSGFVAVLYALNRSGQHGDTARIVVPAIAGTVLLACYTWHALTTTGEPAFDLRLLRRSGFAASLGVMSCVGLIMYSILTSLPIFAAERHGLHGYAQGLFVCALGLGLIVSMTIGGRLGDRTGPRPLVRAGSVLTAAGLASFAAFHDELPAPAVFTLFVATGLSFGLCASPTFSGVYRILPASDHPQGTTAMFMAIQFAGSTAITVLGLLTSAQPHSWLTVQFAVAAGAAAAMTGLSRLLPGRPPGPSAIST
jgi:EmrB/QacA subfamily drug resistance transporter